MLDGDVIIDLVIVDILEGRLLKYLLFGEIILLLMIISHFFILLSFLFNLGDPTPLSELGNITDETLH